MRHIRDDDGDHEEVVKLWEIGGSKSNVEFYRESEWHNWYVYFDVPWDITLWHRIKWAFLVLIGKEYYATMTISDMQMYRFFGEVRELLREEWDVLAQWDNLRAEKQRERDEAVSSWLEGKRKNEG
jgi:hypothetical protein